LNFKNEINQRIDELEARLLGPIGRTQRISVLVAGMFQYVYEFSMKNDKDEIVEYMLSAFEGGISSYISLSKFYRTDYKVFKRIYPNYEISGSSIVKQVFS